MEVERDALLRIVKATRLAMKLAEDTRKLMVEECTTVADRIAGDLEDALFDMIHDKNPGDFKDSTTDKLLNGPIDDEGVTDTFIMFYKVNERMDRIMQGEAEQPKPQVASEDDFLKMYKKNGGYMTPEGDWK